MTQKYCGHCGTPLAENALFCSACGTRRGAGAPSQQPPTPMAPPQPAGTQYAQPLSPSPTSGMPYVVPGTAASSIPGERRGGRKGVLLAGMVGLFLLAAGIAVVVLAFGKPPESLPSGDRKTPTPGISESRPTETTAASHVSQDFLKTDATLEDIVGTWLGEMQFTKMEGFDRFPPDQLPDNFSEIIDKILSRPTAMEFVIEEDGSWYIDIDIEMGMYISSTDFKNDLQTSDHMLLTGLKDGVFHLTHTETIDEDPSIQGSASLDFSGRVLEENDVLFIEGDLRLSFETGSGPVVEEGYYRVSLESQAPEG